MKGTLIVLLATASIGVVPALAASLQGGAAPGCVTVAVPEPVELPDGSIHPAGSLSLCIGAPLSPVTALQRVSVGGMPVGILLSHRGLSEGPATAEPSVMFRRLPSGRLHLVGYAWPTGTRNRTYLLRDPAGSPRRQRHDAPALEGVVERAVEVPSPVLTASLR